MTLHMNHMDGYISYSHSIPFSTIEATYWLRMRWLLEYFGNWVAVAGGVGEKHFFFFTIKVGIS